VALHADIEQTVPAWSPDGRYIAYWSGVEATDRRPGLPRDVWVMNADGTNARVLSYTNGDFGRISWQPVK
jgi:Tol biopolymer transport system component